MKNRYRKIRRFLLVAYVLLGIVLYATALLVPVAYRRYLQIMIIIYAIIAPFVGYAGYLLQKAAGKDK